MTCVLWPQGMFLRDFQLRNPVSFFYFRQPPSFVLSNPRSFCNCSALSSLSRRSCVHRCFETTWHRRIVHSYWLRRPKFAHHCGVKHRVARAGLTIGQMPGPHAFGGLALGYQNTPLLVFHSLRLFTMRQNCWAFWLLRLVYRSGKLITLLFIVFEWLKRIEPNSTTLFITQELDRNQCIHGRTQKFFFFAATSIICLSFTGCRRCNANGRSQNALPFLPH